MPSLSRRGAQRGAGLVQVLGIVAVLTVLVGIGLFVARTAASGAAREGRADLALQAADAAVNRYLARLTADPDYYANYVDGAEDPRRTATGAIVAPGSTWTPGATWTYGTTRTWTSLPSGGDRAGAVEYSLRVSPPTTTSYAVTVEATGRVGGLGGVYRTVEAILGPESIADYQALSNASISYGANAETTGKIYSNEDIDHDGTARAPLYARDDATMNGSCLDACRVYDADSSPTFGETIEEIDFASFGEGLDALRDAASAAGNFRPKTGTSAPSGWLLQLTNSGGVGKMVVRRLENVAPADLGTRLGTISCPVETLDLPTSGAGAAFYFAQPVVINNGSGATDACGGTATSSLVNGRVTVMSASNVYIGGNIAYAQASDAQPDDVLGLIAAKELVIGTYAPSTLSFRAATLAQEGKWRTATEDRSKSRMTFTGSQVMSQGGGAEMFQNRTYAYDRTLLTLRPPYFPTLDDTWRVLYWRELAPRT